MSESKEYVEVENKTGVAYAPIYFSVYQTCANIENDSERLALYDAICKYVFCKEEPKGVGIAALLFHSFKPILENTLQKHERAVANGSKHEAKPKQNEASESNAQADGSDSGATSKQNGTLKVNVDVKGDVEVKDTTAKAAPAPRKRSAAFVKPSLEDVRRFIAEKGYTFTAERFFSHYESNGWKVGKNPMKDWRQACVSWQIRQKEYGEKQPITRDQNVDWTQYSGTSPAMQDNIAAEMSSIQEERNADTDNFTY